MTQRQTSDVVGQAGTVFAPGSRVSRGIRRFVRQQPIGFVSGLVVLLFVAVAFLNWVTGGALTTHDPTEIGVGGRLDGPSLDHFFGTDERGRDLFSRVVEGTEISAFVGLMAVLLAVGGGGLVGTISGFAGQRSDFFIQRVMDAMLAMPGLLLVLVLAAALNPSATVVILGLGIGFLPGVNRVVRGSTLAIKQEQYVEAARAIGGSGPRVMVRHIMPNLVAPVTVLVSIAIGAVIVAEAGLSFIGLGVQQPSISLGQLLNSGRSFMESAPWLVLAPGGAITIVVLAFNLFGDGLRDYLDPRLRNL